MSPAIRWPRSAASTAAVALLWLALLAWARPLMLPDEGRYVGVAWEMMRSGDWLTPTLNGLPYFHKPPLFYWITAASMSLFGVGELPARAAPLLGAWAGAMAVFLFLRRWWGTSAALLALVVLLAQPLFYIGGQFANLDMLVAGCITVTILLLAHAALAYERQESFRWPLAAGYAAAAVGVLAKGLIGFVLPALVVGAWLLVRRRWRTVVALVSPAGAAVFLAITAPWFVAMQSRFAGFLDYFFVVQHFRRFAAGGFNNVQPLWFYPAVVVALTLPWLPWLRPQLDRARLSDPLRGDVRWLMVLWFVLVVAFFSIPASKLVGYVLPAVAPLAVLLADGVESWRQRDARTGRLWRVSAALTVAFSTGVIGFLATHTGHSDKPLGLALRHLRTGDEPVYMLGNYYFDLPVYAGLREPAYVVLNWSDPAIQQRDNWRKELADAAAFAPAADARRLIDPEALSPSLCASPVSWWVGPSDAGAQFPLLGNASADASVVASANHTNVWRLDRSQAIVSGALTCPGIPSNGSAPTS